MAVNEVTVRNWLRVLAREITSGLGLGCILGLIAFARIILWPWRHEMYGPHYLEVAVTASLALVGVVTFGTLVGAMLPILLKRMGFDPAMSSAPFVATLVDVTGIVIYFSVAALLLRGVLL